MRYHKITRFDTANGPGIRTVFWVSGCMHKCKGCHNPETWNSHQGNLVTDDTINELIESLEPDYISGITFSGGDPLYPYNLKEMTNIVSIIRQHYPNKSIWMYTGYTWEELNERFTDYSFYIYDILYQIDVLVDGRFEIDKKDVSLPYCGSSNQRVINVKESLKQDKIILYKEDK